MLVSTKGVLLALFCVSCLLFIVAPVRNTRNGRILNNKLAVLNSILLLITVALLVFASYIKPPSMADYSSYINLFQGTDQRDSIEPAFRLIVRIIKLIDDNYLLLFLFFALISIPLRVFLFNRFSPVVWGSIIVYLSLFYILHDLIQIRAAVASTLLILLVYFSYKRSLKYFIIVYLISFCFHYSAIVFILVWFISPNNNPRMYFFLLLLSYLVYFAHYSLSSFISYIPISSISSLLTSYAGRDSYENNVFNLIQIGRIALAFFFFHNINNERNKYPWFIYFLKVYILGLCFLPLFSSLSGVALRMQELFISCEPIVVPIGFLISFKKDVVSKFAILAYAVVFFYIYYNTTNYWDFDWN